MLLTSVASVYSQKPVSIAVIFVDTFLLCCLFIQPLTTNIVKAKQVELGWYDEGDLSDSEVAALQSSNAGLAWFFFFWFFPNFMATTALNVAVLMLGDDSPLLTEKVKEVANHFLSNSNVILLYTMLLFIIEFALYTKYDISAPVFGGGEISLILTIAGWTDVFMGIFHFKNIPRLNLWIFVFVVGIIASLQGLMESSNFEALECKNGKVVPGKYTMDDFYPDRSDPDNVANTGGLIQNCTATSAYALYDDQTNNGAFDWGDVGSYGTLVSSWSATWLMIWMFFKRADETTNAVLKKGSEAGGDPTRGFASALIMAAVGSIMIVKSCAEGWKAPPGERPESNLAHALDCIAEPFAKFGESAMKSHKLMGEELKRLKAGGEFEVTKVEQNEPNNDI
jgi:hypothetical protein